MDGAGATQVINALSAEGGEENESRWKDPQRVATRQWRKGVLEGIADPLLGSRSVALVELELNHPHPHFEAIVRIDDLGIWYSDGDGHVDDPAWRLRLLPWRHIDGLTQHQVS
jgi:hypothetical protein